MSTPDTVVPDSTLDDVADENRPGRGLIIRRIAVLVLVLIIGAAAGSALGVHSYTATASKDGYTLAVTYPTIGRAGLDVPFTIRVTAPGRIDTDVIVGISADYFRMFETQGFFPDPAEMSADDETVWMTFSAPPTGRALTIDYDAYLQPAAQRGKAAIVTVITDGVPRVSVHIRTLLVP